MAWVEKVELEQGSGKLQPTQVVARAKVFCTEDGSPILQIDTTGSQDRQNPGKQSQTLQFGKEAAEQLYLIIQKTYDFRPK
jgi:hypothetical protein